MSKAQNITIAELTEKIKLLESLLKKLRKNSKKYKKAIKILDKKLWRLYEKRTLLGAKPRWH